mmetsp:Transcript_13417/g.26793  ORF Transcript_13417/g.26793 Transcript_13417/m.26793 type:complete len:520 (-) Transcript_13417:100-1659(-)
MTLSPPTPRPSLRAWLSDRCHVRAFTDYKVAVQHENAYQGEDVILTAFRRENASLRSRLEDMSRKLREARESWGGRERDANTPPLRQPTGFSDDDDDEHEQDGMKMLPPTVTTRSGRRFCPYKSSAFPLLQSKVTSFVQNKKISIVITVLIQVAIAVAILINKTKTGKQSQIIMDQGENGNFSSVVHPTTSPNLSELSNMSLTYLPDKLNEITCRDFIPRTKDDALEMEKYINELHFENVKSYVMFLGTARSGHSWIGSCLDAAPDSMIANEFDAWESFVGTNYTTRQDLFADLARNSYLCGKYGRMQVYNYSIPGMWQGKLRYNRQWVVGDKKGGGSTKLLARLFGNQPWLNDEMAKAQKTFFVNFVNFVKVPSKFIIVLRNPFNIISTGSRYKHKKLVNYLPKVPNEKMYELLNLTLQDLWARGNLGELDQWHVVTMESFANNTKYEMKALCKFVGITCPAALINAIDNQTHHIVHDTFNLVLWTKPQIEHINSFISKYLNKFYIPLNSSNIVNILP